MNNVRNNVRKGFTVIPNALVNDNEMTPQARFLFVYMASKPDDWRFYQSVLAADMGWSLDTLRKYQGELMERGWMSREQNRKASEKFDGFDYTLHPEPCRTFSDTVNFRDGKNPQRKKSALTNNINTEQIINSICPVEEIAPLHIEVITHLNSEAGTKYRSSSAKTKKAISARVAEGYTLDDFRAVIEDRVYRWKGDEKMSEYLRPETLFGPKFEGYLQAAQKADKPNADKALNDCEMTAQEEAGYAEYIKFIHANYMNLYRSECKVLSKADWRNYKGCLTHRGISTALTEQERRQLLARVHDKLNADANFRAKNKSVMDCYLSNARAIANRQTTTV